MSFKPISDKEEQIATDIVDAAYIVHKKLGPGVTSPKGGGKTRH